MSYSEKRITITCDLIGQETSGPFVVRDGVLKTQSSSFVQSSVSTQSFNTSGLWKKETRMVAFKPKPGKKPPTAPRRPFKPEYRPPVLRPQRSNQSKRSYTKVLAKHKALLYVYDMRFKNRMALYESRLAKFNRRLDAFIKYQSKVRYGVPKSIRVRTLTRSELPWHPYERVITFNVPPRGMITSYNRMYYPDRGIDRVVSNMYIGDVGAYSGFNIEQFHPGIWSRVYSNAVLVNARSAADSKARTNLYDKLNDQSVHIANMVAERFQTVSLIADLFKRAVGVVVSFQRRKAVSSLTKWLGSKNALKDAANDTLAFMFGVRPLLDDIAGAAETLAHLTVDNLEDDVVVRARGKSVDNANYTESRFGFTASVQIRQEHEVRYVLQYNVSSVGASELQKLGLINPAEIAWETMPWSFVIDWLLPIGNWLRRLTSETGLQFKRGTKTTETTTYVSITTVKAESPPTSVSPGYNAWYYYKITETRVIRSKKRELLDKSPSIPLPSFKSPLSVNHAIEALALLIQKFR